MPFYEYQCAHCGHHLEAMQKISDAPLKKCPECGKSQLKRLISAPVFRLKGSGWYETDFKGDKDNKRNLHGAEDEAPPSDSGSAKSDDKSDSKADAKPAEDKGKDGAKSGGTKPAAVAKAKSGVGKSGAGKGSAGKPRKSAAQATRAKPARKK